MKMSGEEIIPAPRQTVWAALNDPAVLKQCIPGCESINKVSNTQMEARVVAKVGPVKAGFNGIVHLSDLDPPNGYRISGEGKGGLAGFAKGGATVRLEEVPEGTRMIYDVDAQVGGKLAMLGSRLIDSTARSMAGQFFEKFAAVAGSMKAEAPASKPKKAAAKKPAAKKPAAKKPAKKTVAKKPAKKPAKKKR
jgi:carbon monoxide dehydrogenase subunit G